MDPLDLNIFRTSKTSASLNLFPMENSFYGMSKKTRRKAASPTDDILKVADFAVKSTVALSLTSAALGVAASASQRLNQ